MHEMGVVLNIVREAEALGKQYQVEKIGRLTLQVGELTGILSHFVYSCQAGVELIIEEIEGLVSCEKCGCIYRFLDQMQDDAPVCPACQSSQWQLKQGREVMIKEIGVVDE